MKKRFVAIGFLVALFMFIAPLTVSACGGFVAIRGERVFHSVYCDSIEFVNLDKLRWFDTAEGAKKSGLKMCEECSEYSDWDFDSDGCSTYWTTDNHLLLAAMEMSYDYGNATGHEAASEEYDWYYESGYEAGYESGYEEGYSSGFDEGVAEVSRKIKEQQEEMRGNRLGVLFTVLALVCISLAINAFDKSRKKQTTPVKKEAASAPKPPAIEKNHEEKQRLRDRIAVLNDSLNEHDSTYKQNKLVLDEAYTDAQLEKMVARGEFTAEQASEYISQRDGLAMWFQFAPVVREDIVKMIGQLSAELDALEREA